MRGKLNSICRKVDFWMVFRLTWVGVNIHWAVASWTGTSHTAGNWHWTWLYALAACWWWNLLWNDPNKKENSK